jgi:hypothetical protein
MQNLNQPTWDHAIWYADTPPKDEQLLSRVLLQKIDNIGVEGGWKLKYIFCFMKISHEPLDLYKYSLAQ